MRPQRLTSLELHFAPTGALGPLEEIVIAYDAGPPRRKRRGRDWKSNARTDLFAAALALLWLRGREDPERARLDSRNGEAEAILCAKLHDLWHSPRKRIESHWLDAVFDDGTDSLPSPLARVLDRRGSRQSATVRFATGITPSKIVFRYGEDVVRSRRLWQFLDERFSIPRSAEEPTLSLPAYRTSLIGREAELDALAQLVETERLITLCGPSGVGKTRLAVEVARRMHDFGDGARLVDLSGARTTAHVVQHLLTVFPGSGGDTDPGSLAQRFEGLEMLILLDNCETALAGAAEVATAIIDASDQTVVLATAIEPLEAHAETCYPVHPLAVPPERASRDEMLDAASIRLFLDRAETAGAKAPASERDLRSVFEICRVVGGLPLGIELAASASRSFPLEDLATLFLERMDVVKSADRSAPARHETLRAVVEWTHGLLSETEKRLFACLSVFPTDWDLDAATAVSEAVGINGDDTFRAHGRLTDLAVVRLESTQRFAMLPPLRAFARTRLASSPERDLVAAAFEEHFLRFAELHGDTIERLAPDARNLHGAAESAIAHGRLERASRLVEFLHSFWLATGSWGEGSEICLRILDAPGLEPDVESRVVRTAAGLEFRLGSIAAARGHYARARELALELDDPSALAHAFHGLGMIAFRTHRLDEAESCFAQAETTWLGQGDEKNLLTVTNNLAAIAATQGRFAQATERFSKVVDMASRFGDQRTLSSALMNLGLVAWRSGSPETAQEYFARSLELIERTDDPWGEANVCNNLGVLLCASGDLERSESHHARSLELREKLEDMAGIAASLEGFAELALARGEPRRALRLVAAAGRLRSEGELALTEENQRDVERTREQASSASGAERAEAEERIGGSLSWDEAVSYALGRAGVADTRSGPVAPRD